jgi:hypothetical protein
MLMCGIQDIEPISLDDHWFPVTRRTIGITWNNWISKSSFVNIMEGFQILLFF